MSKFKNKIYYLISNQIPSYIIAEYPKFVEFLEAYYKFLELEGNPNDFLLNLDDWVDIENTLDVFIKQYRKQYSYDIPDSAILDSKRILKYIHYYYEGKGSENSAELFFRFMYNEKIEVKYPGDYILKASDGKWKKSKLLKVDTTGFSENPFDLERKQISLKFVDNISSIGGEVLRVVQTNCTKVVKQGSSGLYQLEVDIDDEYEFPLSIVPPVGFDINGDGVVDTVPELDTQTNLDLYYNTFIYVVYNNKIYGTLTQQIVGVESIDYPGKNFRLDDSFKIQQKTAYFTPSQDVNATNDTITLGNDIIFDTGEKVRYVVPLNVDKMPTLSTTTDYYVVNVVSPGYVTSPVSVSGTTGQFTCANSSLTIGSRITITGTLGGTATISGYVSGSVYKVSSITGISPNVTGFTLTTEAGSSLTTTAGTLTGLTYVVTNEFGKIKLATSYLNAIAGTPVVNLGVNDDNSTLRHSLVSAEYKNDALIRVSQTQNAGIERNISNIDIIDTGSKFLVRKLSIPNDIQRIFFAENYVVEPADYAEDETVIIPVNTATISVEPKYPRNLQGEVARITFKTSPIYKEQGYFKDNAGFLSDINKIQDNYFYQPYSYVIQTQQPLVKWGDTYLKSNHPAGFKLFSELQFIDSLSVSPTIVEDFRIQLVLTDTVSVTEQPLTFVTEIGIFNDDYWWEYTYDEEGPYAQTNGTALIDVVNLS